MNDSNNLKPVPRHDGGNEKKRAEKVIRGSAKVKKKSEIHKFTDIFVAEDINTVKSYLIEEVAIPGVKKIVYDLFVDGLGMLLNGRAGRRSSGTNASYVAYRDYGERRDDYRRDDRDRSPTRYSYNDIVFETRGDAEAVLMRMKESIERYNMVSVLDLYDFANLPSTPNDNKYGWISLRHVEVKRARDGYILDLPKALPLD